MTPHDGTPRKRAQPGNSKPGRLTLAALAEAKRLPVDFLQSLGLADDPRGVAIPYYDAAGHLIETKLRTALKAKDGSYWPKGVPLAAYGDWRLDRANRAGHVYLVEGESDCWVLWYHQLPALGIPGANSTKTLTAEHVACVDGIYIVREPDQGGNKFVAGLARRLADLHYAGRVFELRMPDGVKDPADLHAQDPKQFLARTEAAVCSSAPIDLRQHDGANGKAKAVDERPSILISTEEWRVNDEAVAALAAEKNLYVRGNALVAVLRDAVPGKVQRAPGSPRIFPIQPARLRELLTQHAHWRKARRDRTGEYQDLPAHPPDWSVWAILARGTWPSLRYLSAVVEAPVLRPDGTILTRPGWDEATGLLYDPAEEFPPVPFHPSREAAVEAAEHLFDLVQDFPFAGQEHRAAWLAAVLTTFARHAVVGPCPLIVFDASTPGSGKTLLCDVIAYLHAGRAMARVSYSADDAEMRKVITAVALAGDGMVLLDNVAGDFGNPALDAALTATTWRDRILGKSEMTPELPLHTVWMATGNNFTLRGDIIRRIVGCRLQPQDERPEERDTFAIPHLLEHVRQERPRLVCAALTVLRAYAAAGRPCEGLSAFGSYESWSEIVRGAVHWTVGLDPCATRASFRGVDVQTNAMAALIEGWAELPGAEQGLTVAEALRFVKAQPERLQKLHDAMMEWSRTGDLPSVRVVGSRLREFRDRFVNGKVLRGHENRDGVQLWMVRTE